MTRTISNTNDIIDSRDVIARIEELQGERAELKEQVTSALDQRADYSDDNPDDAKIVVMNDEINDAETALTGWETENGEELKALEALASECEGYASDWKHGEGLIRDSYFEDYARELAEDCGDFPSGREPVRWPYTCIDWKRAAEELQQDYTSAEYDGVTYWIRCS